MMPAGSEVREAEGVLFPSRQGGPCGDVPPGSAPEVLRESSPGVLSGAVLEALREPFPGTLKEAAPGRIST